MSENLDRNHSHPGSREQERAMRLMEALSGVDERLLERSGREDRAAVYRKSLWQRTRAAAAVLCLIAVGAVSWGGYQLGNMKMGSSDSGGAAGAVEEKAVNDAAPQDAVSGDISEGTGLAGQAGAGGEEDLTKQMEQQPPSAWPGDSEGTVIGESESQREMDENGADGFGAVQEAAGEEGAVEDKGQDSAKESLEISNGCLPLKSEKRTEDQARAEAALGAYVPARLPEGYGFEDAYCIPEDSEANLTVCWSRGMDFILLHIGKPLSLPQTVDVGRTELYDERLYEVPYGESVPEEYREIFNSPVFAAEDLSLDLVRSRMTAYGDQGDTDTPRGNFGVLYPDGVLVRFNGRGTAEEIWEMFCSMGGEE